MSTRVRTIPPNTELNMAQKKKENEDRAGYTYIHGNVGSEDLLTQNFLRKTSKLLKRQIN